MDQTCFRLFFGWLLEFIAYLLSEYSHYFLRGTSLVFKAWRDYPQSLFNCGLNSCRETTDRTYVPRITSVPRYVHTSFQGSFPRKHVDAGYEVFSLILAVANSGFNKL